MGDDNIERVNRNIKKIEKWMSEPNITKERIKALEGAMQTQLTVKSTLESNRKR